MMLKSCLLDFQFVVLNSPATGTFYSLITDFETICFPLTTEEELTSYGDGGAGMSDASFFFIYSDGQTTSSGVQLYWMPLTVIQSRTYENI